MRLRQRLALTVVGVAVPLFACLTWAQQHLRQHAEMESLTQLALLTMQSGGRERCEANPSTFSGPHMGPPGPESFNGHPDSARPFDMPPGEFGPPPDFAPKNRTPGVFSPWGGGPPHGPPMRLYPFATDLQPGNPQAPPLSPRLRELVRGDESSVAEATDDGLHALVRMPWTSGPCAVILVVAHHMRPPMQHWFAPASLTMLLTVLGVLLAVVAAMHPIVRRVRVLTREVHRAADDVYATPVAVHGTDEIGELADAFNTAGRQLRAHVEAHRQRELTLRNFLENTTHDITLPLTVLQGHITQMQASARRRDPADVELADAAMREAHYIASLLHNLGVAAKLDAGEPHVRRERVRLNDIVGRAMARHAPVAKKGDVNLTQGVPDEPLWVHADMTFIEQAIGNVIYNAIRYNKAGGHVAVTLDTADGGSEFELQVIDDGPGIPEAELGQLTQRYFRGNEARTRHPGGQGVGLTIAYKVCAVHGWSMTLKPSEFGGLHVTFRGPLLLDASTVRGG